MEVTWAEYTKHLRAELGFSQSRLASLLGVSLSSVQGWESGKVVPLLTYQDILMTMGENLEEVKEHFKQERVKRGVVPTTAKVVAGAGIAYGLYKVFDAVFGRKEKF